MEEKKVEYEHDQKNTESFYDFPLDHPNVTLNKSIENFDEFQKLMGILSDHKESSSSLTDEKQDAMITE